MTATASANDSVKKALLARAARAARASERAFALRDEAIRDAAESASLREIADATGLSKPRVQQIVAAGVASQT